jgi:monofunctional biosynthetic peptidoglycan transglycosylase
VGDPGCHGREYPGGDDPTTQPTEPATRDKAASQCETGSSEPAAAAPLAVWPRAAGGGAAAVAALILPAGAYPADERTLEPETAPAEPAIEPPRSEALSPDEPEPHEEPDDLGQAVQQHADANDVRTPEHAPEPAQPAVPTLQSQPPVVDAPSATLPPLPVTEPRLQGVAAAAPPIALPPQPSASESAPAPAVPWREVPRQPPPGATVEAPRYLRLVLKLAAAVLLALAASVLLLVVLYRWVDPPASTLMLGQRLGGTPITQRWVPLARISPNLPLAVILSEDARFCRHAGVDWGELKEVIESAGDGVARGGSTISMQVVKNLFLWPSKSYLRKAIEIPLAYLVEAAWSKQRVLEIYLNIAEWGPGVFGAEAAARYHFRKPALLLGPREAALLAVSLPNPFERDAGRPGPGTQRLADNLLLRMRAARATAGCVRSRPASE